MEKILESNVLDQFKEDKVRYAMFVNKVRISPSIQDGLKTIHRRIVYGAYKDKKCVNRSSKIKSAELVGAVMGYYHPHGDSATYSAMKPMTNWFEINHPLFNGEGNWGNFQGDASAAMRYTETYLSPFAIDCVIGDLSKSINTVDWQETYNRARVEPKYLPVKVPLLLINGAYGIGVGMISSIPPHNLNEVIEATIGLIYNPDLKVTIIPDQCMECDIIETDWDNICDTGLGKFKVRGRVDIGEIKFKNSMYPCLTIRSLPDHVYLDTIKDKIVSLIDMGSLPQIVDVLDMSYLDKKTDKEIMEYVIVLRKDSDPLYVRDVLYKSTKLEDTIKVSFEVIDGLDSRRISYTEYLQYFIDFRRNTKFRYYSHVYQDTDTKLHEKEAFIKVLQSGEVDNIINMIKKQNEVDDNKIMEYLIKKLNVTDLQAMYILNANIKKLSKGYLNKYLEESKSLMETRDRALNMLRNPAMIDEEIVAELLDIKKKFGKPRNTRVIKASAINEIPEGVFKIIITENNYIKKVSGDDYGTFKGDAPKKVININNTDNLILFDNMGRVYKYPVHKIPVSHKNSNGIDIRVLIKSAGEIIQLLSYDAAAKIANKKNHPNILILTKFGFIKRLDLNAALSTSQGGYAYINLDADDYVTEVNICSGADVIVFTKNKGLRFDLNSVPIYLRNAKGVKTINSTKPFIMEGMNLVKHNVEYIIVITEQGMINKLHSDSLPATDRNRAGTALIKLGKDDRIKAVLGCNESDVINIETPTEIRQVNVSDIKIGSTISKGDRYLNKTSIILSAAVNK